MGTADRLMGISQKRQAGCWTPWLVETGVDVNGFIQLA